MTVAAVHGTEPGLQAGPQALFQLHIRSTPHQCHDLSSKCCIRCFAPLSGVIFGINGKFGTIFARLSLRSGRRD
jgi:hypothetical protein